MSAHPKIANETLAAVSREMVRLKVQHYGKGATEAKSYVCGQFLFCVMKGGLTTIERNLLEHGDAELVRTVRLRFQTNMEETFKDTVQRLTGYTVLTYHSQIVFSPEYVIEMFVLGDEVSTLADVTEDATPES